jgi:hypothetical protein
MMWLQDLEIALSAAQKAAAEEVARAARATIASEERRISHAEAARRLARQLELEGRLESAAASWAEREAQLTHSLTVVRAQLTEERARAVAAAQTRENMRVAADNALVLGLRSQLEQQAHAHAAQLTALGEKLQRWESSECAESAVLCMRASASVSVCHISGGKRACDKQQYTHEHAHAHSCA